MALELGVIADDLTGGMMVASLLEREGVRCPLVTSAEALADLDGDCGAVVVGKKLRLIPAADARTEVSAIGSALKAVDAKRIYYKYCATFDCTDEGNIGPAAEALLAVTGGDRVIFAPAFPEYSVTVFQGRLFVGDRLLSESFKQYDPVTPMTNANLMQVLKPQMTEPVGLISHRVLHRGLKAAREYVDAQVASGVRAFVIDSVDDDDVTRVAELVDDWNVTTGGDALPGFLARQWLPADHPPGDRTVLPAAPGHEAVIAGSCAPPTLRQLDHFETRYPVFRIDLAGSDDGLLDQIRGWAAEHVPQGPVAVCTSADVAGVERAQEALGKDGAAARADSLLGEAAKILYELGVRKLVVAGGETSGQVFGALGIRQVEVGSFDDLSGGYCFSHAPGPLAMVVKAGGLGNATFFEYAFERMRRSEQGGVQ
ncbi:MAG: four-carbon acid sugar kinase family protein [Gammaproteobacteria bacterium]|nr:four-carbon acid sugar kinase family protein [Gammaproteobacteria bacterium]